MSNGRETHASRRSVLKGLGGAASIATTGLAGCVGGLGGTSAPDEINLAYMPIYPDMQYFVMQGEDYLDELDVTVNAKRFPDGPSIVQAFGSGKFDVAMFGVVPSLVVIDKGIGAKIVAANIKDAMSIMTSDEFADLWERHGKDAFARFEERTGRKFTFGTFPPGSVPDILLRYWMTEEVGLPVEEAVEVVPMGAGKVRQALLAGEIDGTSIMEPIPTIVEGRDAPYRRLANAGEFFEGGQPAAVVLMSDGLREENPEIGKAFLEQHVRSTEFARTEPDAAAEHASTVIGEEVLSPAVAKRAMRSPTANFISDPHQIADGTKVYSKYARDLGKLDARLKNDAVFDFSLYDEVSG